MDDGKGLELSLGLPCSGGKSSSNSKEKSENSYDIKPDTDERTCKILNDFKNFLNAGVSRHPFQRVKSQENLFSSPNVPGNELVSDNKRKKNMSDEGNICKRQEIEARISDSHDKGKTSRVSITTDECSTADNEDVVDSVAQVSPPQCDDGSKALVGNEKAIIGGAHLPKLPFTITVKESPTSGMIPVTNGEHPGNVPMPFGYSSNQLPVLDNHSRAMSTPGLMQVSNPGSSEPIRIHGPQPEQPKDQTGNPFPEQASSSHSADNNMLKPNTFQSEYPSIRPGIAADVKFVGPGSFPDLPWVSTTGPGPNGRTISGVTYRYNETQIKIVCACHGVHMSPDEFVRHASSKDPPPSVSTSSVLASVPSSNPAASARS